MLVLYFKYWILQYGVIESHQQINWTNLNGWGYYIADSYQKIGMHTW